MQNQILCIMLHKMLQLCSQLSSKICCSLQCYTMYLDPGHTVQKEKSCNIVILFNAKWFWDWQESSDWQVVFVSQGDREGEVGLECFSVDSSLIHFPYNCHTQV